MTGNEYKWLLIGISLMLMCRTLEGVLLQNVAFNQTAVQSSLLHNGTADKAVDGNRDPTFKHGSCTHTNNESNPWWRVELQDVYKITAVLITNREVCAHRLDGAEVWIGLSLENNGAKNFRCGVITHLPEGRTLYISCSGMEARYVTVLLPGEEEVLTLCEVEVYSLENENLVPNRALRGEAVQSSTTNSGDASKAIDGKRNSFFDKGSCTQTGADKPFPWWRLDLKKMYAISSVKVTNRGDCCADSLDGAEIRIGNSLENNGNNNPRCATISHIRAGKTLTLYCERGSMEGRYVNVINSGTGKTLSLCEVEVYAAPTVQPLENVALKGQAIQSSTWPIYGFASNAINGGFNRTIVILPYVYTQCCSHTLESTNPWWRVDLLAVHKVHIVVIFNREDCCPERINGARILIGYSLVSHGIGNPMCDRIWSVKSSYTFHCGGMEGRYVVVYLPGFGKILSMAEVEVYASLKEAVVTPPILPTPPPTTPPLPPPPSLLPPPPPPTAYMRLNGRNVTLVGERLCWSDALFYCRSHHGDLLGLLSQEEQSQMEQILSQSPFPLTDNVWIGLRRDLMGDRWFWMSKKPMYFTKWQMDVIPDRLHHACGGMAREESFVWVNLPCEELLNFICQSDGVDRAHEVYFYSNKYKKP